MNNTTTAAAAPNRTAFQTETDLNIFQRVAENDKTAYADCIDAYGNFVWTLAKKITSSTEEAEAATREIFIDIWRYAISGGQIRLAEKVLIALIARRCLVKYSRQT